MDTDSTHRAEDATRAGRILTDAARQGPLVTKDALADFLRRQSDLGGTLVAIAIDETPRKAGASSGTVLFDADIATPAGNVRRSLVFRYDLGGAFFRQYALAPQFWTMKSLSEAGFPAPRPLWLDEAGAVAGKPGMVMEKARGAAPSISPFTEGPLMAASAEERRVMLLNAARILGRLHRLDPGRFSHLAKRGRGEGFIAQEINWVLDELRLGVQPLCNGPKRAFYTHVCATLERVARYLREAAPYRAPEFAHGDANITNCMYDGTEIVCLLDYELSHLGLGEADLGYQLAGMAHFQLLNAPVDGVPCDDEMIEAYREARGKLTDWPYARLLGEWRLATFAAMGMSRLSPDLDHVERAYWEAAEQRMHQIAPRIVPMERPA